MNPTQELANIIRTALSNGEFINVTFKKVDGTTACDRKITRNLLLIPKDKHPKFVRGENPHYITAFDLKKGDWIRFHEDSIIGVMGFSREAEIMCYCP
jgi:hypothetical protein